MTKRELELERECARLKGQIEVLERELAAAREPVIVYQPTVVEYPRQPWPTTPYPVIPVSPTWTPYIPTITCGGTQ